MTARALVIGFGSIGNRHARVLSALGFEVLIVSRRVDLCDAIAFSSVQAACRSGPFDYVVIANETYRHQETLSELAAAGHRGRVLVEKPLFANPAPLPLHHFERAGYRLQFALSSCCPSLASRTRGATRANGHVPCRAMAGRLATRPGCRRVLFSVTGNWWRRAARPQS